MPAKGLTIQQVDESSACRTADLRSGDRLISINGHPIRDEIDVQFYGADEMLDCLVQREGEILHVSVERSGGGPLGLSFEAMRFGCCGNHCTFCFIDQNPKGMRETIYFKDEDYRLSFLHGNYVTLTRLKQADLERIVEQRLSPLYMSIHATDLETRKRLLGLKKDDRLLEKLDFLCEHGIELHGQIVLCPGFNDGEILEDSLKVLEGFHPGLQTLSIVPVGLTHHRDHLPVLNHVSPATARAVIQQVSGFQRRFKRMLGDAFVYLADEFYLLAHKRLPPTKHYGEFWQIENGVGLTRDFLDDFSMAARDFPGRLDAPREVILVTGMLAAPVLKKHVLPRLNRIGRLKAEVKAVPNQFYGSSVTVSGLLTGGDILSAFAGDDDGAELWLPPNCLNTDGLFLDDRTPEDLASAFSRAVRIVHDFNALW